VERLERGIRINSEEVTGTLSDKMKKNILTDLNRILFRADSELRESGEQEQGQRAKKAHREVHG
jgi:hypothetical protein